MPENTTSASGWDGEHLHRFVIHGGEYGGYVGGVGFRDDPYLVRLVDLGLRPTERFVYDYDRHRRLAPGHACRANPGHGSRSGLPALHRWPPGRPAGGLRRVQAFLENTQPHHVLAAAIRAAEILGMLLETEDLTRFGEHRDELAGLLPLLVVDRFDRRTLNRALAALSATGTRAA